MTAGSAIPTWIMVLLAAVCAALLAWDIFGYVLPFQHDTGQAMLDTYFAGYDVSTVVRMQQLLAQNETAAGILRAMYLGPELVLPAALTALLLLIFMRLGPIDAWRGRSVHPVLGRITYVLPLIYGLADYAENIAGLLAFGESPSSGIAAALLPWLTRLKFASLAICLILIVRFLMVRTLPRSD
ncbi:hypothetical protein [Rhizobium sp. BK251]|uniref:hypothetical protein n=1 Tax=Rhizobium sp. BK251 TaxID=2512125 RepID=UPI0010511B46|nr:hypothetical protein [Rhizobium sp. BK251]TCL75768.1 hypothetical protein EV286_101312 [Rhizobium sp. BK251]